MNQQAVVRIDAEDASDPGRIWTSCPATRDRAVEDVAVAHGLSPREVRWLAGAEPNLSHFALAFEQLRLQQIA